jgi:hypothetical protein
MCRAGPEAACSAIELYSEERGGKSSKIRQLHFQLALHPCPPAERSCFVNEMKPLECECFELGIVSTEAVCDSQAQKSIRGIFMSSRVCCFVVLVQADTVQQYS